MRRPSAFHRLATDGDLGCRLLDQKCHSKDTRLFTAFNQQTQRYELYRDHPDGRQELITICETPDGRYLSPEQIQFNLHRTLHDGDLARPGNSPREFVERLNAGNQQRQDREWQQDKDEALAVGEYVRKWEDQAERGQPRYPATDVIAGLASAMGDN